MLKTGAGIIGNSNATLQLLSAHAAEFDVLTPPMLAAWLGVTPLPAPDVRSLDALTPYFVTLGTIEGRKNHIMLLNVWRALITKYGSSAPRLVIIGQRGWESKSALTLLDTDEQLRNYVVELPRCTDAELAGYLRNTQALLFPSFAEGYGIPLVEALGMGTPVIASDLAVFQELAGSIPEYLAPTDTESWQAAVEAYMAAESPARRKQLARIARYKMPTWSEHFAKVERWLETI
jgi:glycosyltransferase involved in cell wall biosynthesis